MKWLVAFAAGYVLGARAEKQDFDDVVQALRGVRDSDEVRELVLAMRNHAGHALRGLADLVERGDAGIAFGTAAGRGSDRATASSVLGAELVERVRRMIGDASTAPGRDSIGDAESM